MSGEQIRSEEAIAATETSIARIAEVDPKIHAFVCHDPSAARAAATVAQGPLAGCTLGVKDIIDTAAYPTSYGSEIYAGNTPRSDAASVALLTAAGAVTLGKTVTTEFAFFRPGPTRNPHDLGRTPGGSSSGSAAAVAAGLVTLALGSQTAASLTRPASYCGVVGFKPSFGRYSLAGVKGLAPSFDTLGTLGANVNTIVRADAALCAAVPIEVSAAESVPLRIGLCRTPWWHLAEDGTRDAMDHAQRLFGTHVPVEAVDLDAFAKAAELHSLIMGFESAQALAWEYNAAAEMMSPQILKLVRQGRDTGLEDYRTALAEVAVLRREIERLFDRYDVLLAPAAPGEAPEGLQATGDPIFSRIWTLLRLPSITVPGLTGPKGLPVGVQLFARLGDDARLLEVARWAEHVLPSRPIPRLDAA